MYFLLKMKNILLVISIVLVICFISCDKYKTTEVVLKSYEYGPTKEYFKVYHPIHAKSYNLNSEEGILRYRIFKQNLKMIQEVNSKNLKYKFSVNRFTDMSQEEFKQKYLMKSQGESSNFMDDYFDRMADMDDQENLRGRLNNIDYKELPKAKKSDS